MVWWEFDVVDTRIGETETTTIDTTSSSRTWAQEEIHGTSLKSLKSKLVTVLGPHNEFHGDGKLQELCWWPWVASLQIVMAKLLLQGFGHFLEWHNWHYGQVEGSGIGQVEGYLFHRSQKISQICKPYKPTMGFVLFLWLTNSHPIC